jgi:hypothetical protein
MKINKFIILLILISSVISCNNIVIPDSEPSVKPTVMNGNALPDKETLKETGNNLNTSTKPVENDVSGYLPDFNSKNSNSENFPYVWQNNSIVLKDNEFFYSGINTNLTAKNFSYEINTSKFTPLTSCPYKSLLSSNETEQICWLTVYSLIKGRDENIYTYNINGGGIIKIRDEAITTYILNIRDNFSLSGLAADTWSNMYITNTGDGTIKKISPDNREIQTYSKYNTTGDGIFDPKNIEVDNKNNIYFFDAFDLKIKKLTQQGLVNTIIGGGSSSQPEVRGNRYKIPDVYIKIFVDNFDNLYLAERTNNRILKFAPDTEILSVFAGDGIQGYSGENILAVEAHLYWPASVTFDQENNAYILDLGNSLIRKADYKSGRISTFIGRSKLTK